MRSSVCQLSNVPNMQVWKGIGMLLSYIDQGIFYSTRNYHAARKYLLTPAGSFPTGLLEKVIKHLQSESIPYETVDLRVKPASGNLGLATRVKEPAAYKEQHAAVDACLNDPEGRGIIVMPTGVGKTRVIKDLIQRLDTKLLVVPPSANLKRQIHDYLKDCFGARAVGYFDKADGCKKHITIGNIDGLESAKKHHFKGVGAVIIDEFHHSAAATYRIVNENLWDDVYYKFGFTATDYRNNPMDQILLESVLHRRLFMMTPVEAIQRGYIVPVQPLIYNVNNFELDDTQNYATCYKRFIVENEERNLKIVDIAKRMIGNKVPTLVLVKQVPHGRGLAEAIPGAVFVNGQDNDSQWNMEMVKAFNNLEVPCLVGTSVIGEGVDTKAAGCVILASGEKAKSRIMQNVGRVVRCFPNKNIGYVVDFFDRNSKIMEKHSQERYNIYMNEFGSRPHIFT
jgi:DNA repair protein RadD